MKRFLMLIFALMFLITSSVFADGIYLNAALMRISATYNFNINSPFTSNTFSKGLYDYRFIGTVAAGLGKTFQNNFYLGGEIGTSLNKSYTNVTRPGLVFTGSTFRNQVQVRDNITLDILPGYRFWPRLLTYARFGIANGHVVIQQDSNAVAPGFNNSADKFGARFGLGLDYLLWFSKLSVGLDYIYSNYNRFDTTSPSGNNFNVKPWINSFGAHLRYNFG